MLRHYRQHKATIQRFFFMLKQGAMIPNSSRVPEFLIDLGKNFIWLKYEKAHATANLRQNDIGHDLPSSIHPESSG